MMIYCFLHHNSKQCISLQFNIIITATDAFCCYLIIPMLQKVVESTQRILYVHSIPSAILYTNDLGDFFISTTSLTASERATPSSLSLSSSLRHSSSADREDGPSSSVAAAAGAELNSSDRRGPRTTVNSPFSTAVAATVICAEHTP
jgi:hypothetical protein